MRVKIQHIAWLLLNFLYTTNARVPKSDGRIIGGKNASILEFPYQVSLRRYGQHICGGSIFHNAYILTAAHCVTSGIASQYSIRAGSDFVNSGGKQVKVCSINAHDGYNQVTLDNDIAILKLCSPLGFSSNILPVALPETGEELAAGTAALISGWGYENEDGTVATILKQVEIPVVSHNTCQKRYVEYGLTKNMFCAGLLKTGGKDACQGDSGGPLRANGKLMGIVSWGLGCARAQYPGVYTKVSNYRSWIKKITNY